MASAMALAAAPALAVGYVLLTGYLLNRVRPVPITFLPEPAAKGSPASETVPA